MKIKTFWTTGGAHVPHAPLRSATELVICHFLTNVSCVYVCDCVRYPSNSSQSNKCSFQIFLIVELEGLNWGFLPN